MVFQVLIGYNQINLVCLALRSAYYRKRDSGCRGSWPTEQSVPASSWHLPHYVALFLKPEPGCCKNHSLLSNDYWYPAIPVHKWHSTNPGFWLVPVPVHGIVWCFQQ